MNVLLLGAGASKAYTQSKHKIKMPISKDFFQTYGKLEIAEKPDVLIGDIVRYLKKYHKINEFEFLNYAGDIEDIHSEISDKVIGYAKEKGLYFSGKNCGDKILTYKAYMQLLFLFNSVINEIQNGEISIAHINIAKNLEPSDVILTFNWDTLMDRALESITKWNVYSGYCIHPKAIYDDGWITNDDSLNIEAPYLIKLHGSTNWLTSYMSIENGNWKLIQDSSPDVLYVYRTTLKAYDTYQGRYWPGYEPFSYGYYPPNIPDKGEEAPKGYCFIKAVTNFDNRVKNNISGTAGLVSMPAIIPPIKQKSYNLFGNVFTSLWNKAEESLAKADKIIIIGYSFPKTDFRTDELFKKAFCKRTTKPKIVIINPDPDELVQKFIYEYGIDNDLIRIEKTYFDEHFDFESVINI